MSQSQHDLKTLFTKEIQSLLEDKYGSLLPNELLNAFYGALQEHCHTQTPAEKNLTATKGLGWLDYAEEDGRRVYWGKRDGDFVVALEIFSARAFLELTNQMRKRTVITKTPVPQPRGTEFDLCVMLPIVNKEVWIPAKVLTYSDSGLVYKVLLSSNESAVWKRTSILYKSGQKVDVSDAIGPITSP